jgi:hypothetical protein
MEDQTNTTPTWEAMEVEEVGHVGEILQGDDKISTVAGTSRGPTAETF